MAERRALVVATPTSLAPRVSGAGLRLADIRAVLADAGHDVTVVRREQVADAGGGWDVGVAVSYASAGALRDLAGRSRRLWLDAVDSWLLVDGSGVRARRPAYLARAVRDAVRVSRTPRVDLLTYISAADRRGDRGTLRATSRLVLPGRSTPPPLSAGGRKPRLVLAGDWAYPPNVDGLRWLRRHVVPRLTVPVHVYGHGAPEGAGLVRHGHVDDERELYAPGDVHLAPVYYGGGVKRKVLQPLLAGLPVVARSPAARGLLPHPLLEVADAPADFAAAAGRRLGESAVVAPPPVLPDRDDTAAIVQWLVT